MRRLLFFGAATVPLVTLSPITHAEGTTDLGPVTVTATRTPLVADQVVAPVIVITAQQLQLQQARTLDDVLRLYAGLDVASNGGPGQPASLFLRGTNSNQTLVLIDGVKLNPATSGGAALQNIRLDDIERIEIVKGPRAALYGSDAIGGVINIITKRAATGTHYGAHAGAGRYGTYDTGGHFGYGTGDSAFSVSASDFHTDGFPSVQGSTIDNGNTDRTVNATGRARLGPLALKLDHWQSRGDTQYLDFFLNPLDENFQDQTTGLDLTAEILPEWRSNLNLSHMLDEVAQLQSPDFVHTQRNVVDWQNDLALGESHLLTAGLYTDAEHSASSVFGTTYDDAHRVNALYLEDDFSRAAHRLVAAGRETHDQAFGSHFTWNVDYGYDLTAMTRLTAGAGTGFRAPNATERFGFGGNPNLRPETSRNLEAGLRERIGQDQQLTLSAFRNSLDDLIDFTVTPSAPLGINENIAHARVTGLETEYALTHDAWDWRTDAIFQRPENLGIGTLLPRRARRTLTTALGWHDDRNTLSVNLLATGPRKDSDFSTLTDAGYVLTGVSYRRDLGGGLSLLGRLDNVFDIHYQTAAGYNTAGRSLYLSLGYDTD